MASDVDICNLALTKLGQQPIPSLTSTNPPAPFLNRVYFAYRDELQTIWRWNFNLRYAELAALTTAPPFGYSYAYQLPPDCLSLRLGDILLGNSVGVGMPIDSIGDFNFNRNANWQIVGTQVWTDIPAPFRIQYSARVTDSAQFDASFVNAFASYLAWNCCEQLMGGARKDQMQQMYMNAIRMARMNNAIQLPPETIPDDTFMLSRLG